MNLGEDIANQFLVESRDNKYNEVIALYPGAFKPPHIGHFHIVDEISKRPEITQVNVLIGHKERDGVTKEQSLAIWDIYKKYLNNKVNISISNDKSPITEVLNTVKENPNNYYILVFGRDEDSSRFKSALKYPNIKIINISDVGINDISGTKARQEILNSSYEGLQRYLPTELNNNERKKIWDIVSKEPISENILNEYHNQKELNPNIWVLPNEKYMGDSDGQNYVIKPKVREVLLKVANYFWDKLDSPINYEDILLIGSSANYNWTKYSDIDLHILVDLTKFKDPTITKAYFDSMKVNWNENHKLKIGEQYIEVYIQDKNEPNAAEGIYSLLNDEWLKQPEYKEVTVNDKDIERKAQPFKQEIDNIIEKGGDIEHIKKLQDRIKNLRKTGLETKGEYSVENLAFKELRNSGYIGKIIDLRNKLVDKELVSEISWLGEKYLKEWQDFYSKEHQHQINEDINEYGSILEYNIDLKNIYNYESKGNFYTFYDDINKVEILVKLKNQGDLTEFKFYVMDGEQNLSFNSLKIYNSKVLNTVFYIFLNEVLPNHNQVLIQPFNNIRFRLFRALLNNNLNKDEYDIKVKGGLGDEQIIILKKDKEPIQEGKQVGILYHYTLYDYLDYIMQQNTLKASRLSTADQYVISFTRNKNFQNSPRQIMGTECRLVIDGDKLSNNYKITPIQEKSFIKNSPISRKETESEERIDFGNKPGEIKDLDKYVINYDLFLDKMGPHLIPIFRFIQKVIKDKGLENKVRYFFKNKQVDIHDPEFAHMKLLRETQESTDKTPIDYINELIQYCCKELNITEPEIIFVKEDYVEENHSYGGYQPGENKIYIFAKSRMVSENMRTLSHELKHCQQDQNNELTPISGEDGSEHENEANSYSGKTMRYFNKLYPEILLMKYD